MNNALVALSSFSAQWLPSLTINRITHEKRLINSCVLLGQNGQKVQVMNLPSYEEALTILQEKLIKSVLHSGYRKTNILGT